MNPALMGDKSDILYLGYNHFFHTSVYSLKPDSQVLIGLKGKSNEIVGTFPQHLWGRILLIIFAKGLTETVLRE